MTEESGYTYRWNFGDGEKSKVSLDYISECHAYIMCNGKFLTEYYGKGEYRDFLKKLANKIIDAVFQDPEEEEEKRNTKDAVATAIESSGMGSVDLSKNFFFGVKGGPVIKDLVNGQSLAGSYLEFNRNPPPKNSSTSDSNNQADNAEGDAGNLIEKAIENSAKSKKCVIFTGAPGTGKTYCVEEYVKRVTGQNGKNRAPHPNWEFVQFHSSYDYTDFVEGLRPVQIDRKMEFVRMDGIFKAFCRRAAGEKGDFYFIIDEINRADLGRVFGELMYCFEKRGEEHRITTPYANLPTCDKHGEPLGNPLEDKDGKSLRDNDGCFEGGFYIPDNVIIIGTMNDIDRSVETFDFALRRRFDWVEVEADAVMKSSLTAIMEKKLGSEERGLADGENKFIAELVSELLPKIKAKKDDKGAIIGGLNGIIETQSGLGKEFKIGPAYFKDYDVKEGFKLYKEEGVLNQENHKKNLNAIWELNIEPVLREYVRGRQGADEFIAKCRRALLSEKNEGKGGNSQDAEPQENKDGADAQPGEQK